MNISKLNYNGGGPMRKAKMSKAQVDKKAKTKKGYKPEVSLHPDYPRNDYINWNQFFMGVARLASLRSKDPSTQVGCCIVKNSKIIGVGYNGMVNGVDNYEFPWGNKGKFTETKYAYVVHAELNAILNTANPELLKGATLYCTLPPCNECAKAIIQAGIKSVIYTGGWREEDYHDVARRMFDAVGIDLAEYKEYKNDIRVLR